MDSVIRSPEEWPILLAGPMVRRVTNEQICVFICTSVECTGHLRIFADRVDYDTSEDYIPGTEATTTPIGEKLHVTVLEADIADKFDDGQTVSYDIYITYSDEEAGVSLEHNLFSLGLLGGDPIDVGEEYDARRAAVPLGYEASKLPSFKLPPGKPADLRIAHASCRKPHGSANKPDALQIIDAQIEDSLDTGEKRPHQLILTGDQIYADDVPAALLAACTEAGDALLGWHENYPPVDFLIGENTVLLQPGWRTRFLGLRQVGLKELEDEVDSDLSASHLLRFGEWCAMYLFCWSDALWAVDSDGKYYLPDPDLIFPGVELIVETHEWVETVSDLVGTLDYFFNVSAKLARYANIADRVASITSWLQDFTVYTSAHWIETREAALSFAESVCYVRRALANVPTYMMFDDHEITDDWFLNGEARDLQKGVGADPEYEEVGPRLLRNGLSAYAIFQHWGNVPEDFKNGRQGEQLLDLWKWNPSAGDEHCTLEPDSHTRDADELLGISPGDSSIPSSGERKDFSRFRWDYAIDFSCHRLVSLDTRTWREYPSATPFTWSDLAPLHPNDPGQAGDCGGPSLEAVGDAWLTAFEDTGEVAMESLGLLLKEVVALAELVDQDLEDVVEAAESLFSTTRALLEQVPSRLALSDPIDPAISTDDPFFTEHGDLEAALSALSNANEAISACVDALQQLSQFDFGPSGYQLNRLLECLREFLDSALRKSAYGMANAARKAADWAGEGMWTILGGIGTSGLVYDTLLASQSAATSTLDSLTESIGLDELAEALFRDGSGRLGAGLIRKDALQFQVVEPLATLPDRPLTVLLSPAPVFGHSIAELGQRCAVFKEVADGERGEYSWDYEPWTVNMVALRNLFDATKDLQCALILSGDVHYANSSVNDVYGIDGVPRYIQLTSSSAHNAAAGTEFLGSLDDLIYDSKGEFLLFQSDFAALMEEGSAAEDHLKGLVESVLMAKIGSIVTDIDEKSEELWRFMTSGVTVTLDDVAALAMSVPDTIRKSYEEAAYKVCMFYDAFVALKDDPVKSLFGDYLTAGPLFRQTIRGFYEQIGVDQSAGFNVESTVLVDRREDRLGLYPQLAIDTVLGRAEENEKDVISEMYRRTVGNANVGLITLTVRDEDEIVSVSHEIRWYPDSIEKVSDVSRSWMGTVHEAGWWPHRRDPLGD